MFRPTPPAPPKIPPAISTQAPQTHPTTSTQSSSDLPEILESALSTIETLAVQTSSVPFGAPLCDFDCWFSSRFIVTEEYEDDELWEKVDPVLNKRIGVDVLPTTLRRGPYGVDLLRTWIPKIRTLRGWSEDCDKCLAAKLKSIITHLEKCLQVSLDPLKPALPSSADQRPPLLYPCPSLQQRRCPPNPHIPSCPILVM
jgi:hypothetical protein